MWSAQASAIAFNIDPLYWSATETIDWAYDNNLNANNQSITYQTPTFPFKPGIRIGIDLPGKWENKFTYTSYYTKTFSTAGGNLVGGFFGAHLTQGSTFFYKTGQINFGINYNMLDWELHKSFAMTDAIVLQPLIGIRGGWIYQTITTNMQGQVNVNELVKNNFRGIGPKAGVASNWILSRSKNTQYSIVADLTACYLWGHWDISDVAHTSTQNNVYVSALHRNLGAFALQALAGLGFTHKGFAIKFGYEVADWFNQFQVFDDSTGANNGDLLLQGLTLSLTYRF